MHKTIFFINFASSIVILTLSTILWFSDDSFSMTGSPLHFLMTVVGSVVLSWCLFEMRDIHHADEIFADSIDDHEWGALECMLKNYRRYYETELKNSPMYESGMCDIDGWLHYVEQFRK